MQEQQQQQHKVAHNVVLILEIIPFTAKTPPYIYVQYCCWVFERGVVSHILSLIIYILYMIIKIHIYIYIREKRERKKRRDLKSGKM